MSKLNIIFSIHKILNNAIFSIFSLVIDLIIININFLPTDVFSGLLDVSKEPFMEFMPYVNWFVPLDYAVTLVGSVLDVYGIYVIWKYTKKVISVILANYGNYLKIVSGLLS